MENLTVINHKDQRVLTTQQLAEKYGTETKVISYNFNYNKERYQEGVHFFILEGQEKRDFFNRLEFHDSSKNAQFIYLWTEKGCLQHAKSLGTDQAWEVYGMLIDTYFRVKQQQVVPQFVIPQTYPEALRLAASLAEENTTLKVENNELKAEVVELQPKASYCDMVLLSKDTVTATMIAKDYGMSAVAFNQLLHRLEIQYKVSGQWVLYRQYDGKGYVASHTVVISTYYGEDRTSIQTRWTQKGRLFLYGILKENGVIPVIEKENFNQTNAQ